MSEVVFVDLDGTLLRTDTLWEAFFELARTRPRALFCIPGWLWRGRAYLKRRMAECVALDSRELPLREVVADYLATAKLAGDRFVLATAADEVWAKAIADRTGFFEGVLASDGVSNLKGSRKLAAIQKYCAEHNIRSFGYIGDSPADVPIWRQASRAIVVNPKAGLLRRVEADRAAPDSLVVLRDQGNSLGAYLKAMRVQQWAKNVLMFVPLFLAHRLGFNAALGATAAAFVAFSGCASAVYLLNDMLDLPADRRHPRKRRRPLAAGEISIASGCVLAAGLLAAGLGLGAVVSFAFLALLVSYIAITTLYSVWLKRKVLIDVLILASLYTLRVIAGGVAAGVVVSEWLLAFCVFLFFSLGFLKRFSELSRLQKENHPGARGRGYRTSDLSLIESMGVSSGFMAVLVFALYIHSDDVSKIYAVKWPLWLVCPVLLHWVARVWFHAKRGCLREDPVLFAITDRLSLAAAAIVLVLVLTAKLGWAISLYPSQ